MTFALSALKFVSQKKRTLVILTLVVTAFLFLLSTQAIADMFGLFKKYDVHLSPEVHGTITNQGKPVVGLEVSRGLTYGDNKELIDTSTTDAKGKFKFAEKNIRSRKPGSMFDESRIRQVVFTKNENKDFMLWYTQAIGIEPNKALTDRLQKLHCELTDPEQQFEFDSVEYPQSGYLVHSICRW